MAKIKSKTAAAKSGKPLKSPFSVYWTKQNYFILAAGVILAIIGFFLLSGKPWDTTKSLTVAPIILFVAYVILFPLSILFRPKSEEKKQSSE